MRGHAARPDRAGYGRLHILVSLDGRRADSRVHPGGPMGMADIATVLFRDFTQFDAADPHWFDRARFVLSNGHASMLL